jgi:hypothetical protein
VGATDPWQGAAQSVIAAAGFTGIQRDQRQPGGVQVSFAARDGNGRLWFFDVTGSFTSHRAGLKPSGLDDLRLLCEGSLS